MVGDVGERAADYGLTPAQQDFLEWVRRVAGDLADVPPVHGAVNRPLVTRLGELGLLRALFGGDAGRASPRRRRDAAVPAPRGAGRGQHRGRDRARAAGPRLLPDPPVRQRRHPRPLAARGGERRRRTGVRAVRARRRLGRRRAVARGPAGRRRLDPPRHQDLDLQRPRRRRLHRLRPHHARREGARRHRVRGGRRQRRASAASGSTWSRPTPSARSTSTASGSRATTCSARSTQGFGVAMRTLDLFRPSVGAFAVGMAQAALDASLAWATERELFGGRLIDQQATQHTLAEMATRIEAGRLLVRRAAAAYDGGSRAARRRSPPARRRPSCSRPRPPSGWSTRRSSCTVRGGSSAGTCSSGSIVRSGRRGSTRAPPRCSGRSSPADS